MTRTKTSHNRRRSNGRRHSRKNSRSRSYARVANRRVAYATAPNRRRGKNPRRRRSHNPQVKSLVIGGLWAGAGAAVTNIIAGFIPIGGGGWMDIVKGLVAAYATGFLAEKFTSPANANLMAIGGFAGTAWSAVNMMLGGAGGILGKFLPGQAQPQLVAAPAAAPAGVSGFYDVTSYPDGMGDLVVAPDEYDSPGY